MSLLDVELGPRSAEDRGLVFSGTARTTLWFQYDAALMSSHQPLDE